MAARARDEHGQVRERIDALGKAPSRRWTQRSLSGIDWAFELIYRAWYMEMRNAAQWLFLLTGLTLAYLVLPPFFFILHTSLVVDRGLQAGAFTFQHFANIVESLGDVRTLLENSVIFSVGSAAIALVYGTMLAWLSERSDAPFRKLSYVSAYVSFAIP